MGEWRLVPPERAAAMADGDPAILDWFRAKLASGEWQAAARMVNGVEEAYVGLPAEVAALVAGEPAATDRRTV